MIKMKIPNFEQKIISADCLSNAETNLGANLEKQINEQINAQLKIKLQTLPHPIVMTNGVFDLLHRGHVTYLAQAKALGASLVVAVNTDASVKRLGKGDERPINTCEDRMAVLAALESVSLVIAFDEDTALEAVQRIKPDIYVKGGDYQMDQIPEGKAVLAYGGQVQAIIFEHDRSTTKTLIKLQKNQQKKGDE